MKRLAVVIGLALCFTVPASAQLYKWVDSNGKVQYSDKPPPSNIKTEKLRTPPPAPTPSAPADAAAGAGGAGGAAGAGDAKDGTPKDGAKSGLRTAAEQEQAFRKRQAESAKAQEKQAQKDKEAGDRAENCKRARAALANLELGGRQSRIDEKGERVFLDEQQITQETAKARQEVATACK